jgi:hypothetical protein
MGYDDTNFDRRESEYDIPQEVLPVAERKFRNVLRGAISVTLLSIGVLRDTVGPFFKGRGIAKGEINFSELIFRTSAPSIPTQEPTQEPTENIL